MDARRSSRKGSSPMLHIDDMQPGQVFTFGSYTLTEEAILEYAREWDPLPIHADPAAAAGGPHGGIIASGLQTMAVYQRLIVEALWSQVRGIGGRGFTIRFVRPVKPGTTLTGKATIRDVQLRPDRGTGVVELDAELVDQEGETVMQVEVGAVLLMRSD